MKEKNEENQVAIITKEWEITKDYIFEVAMKHGLINLDCMILKTLPTSTSLCWR